MTIASRIREVRERRHMSQSELAAKANLRPSAISHFECGRREPCVGNLAALAVALGATADYLLGIERKTGGDESAEGQLMRMFRGMRERERGLFLEFAKTWNGVREEDAKVVEGGRKARR